MRYILNEGAPYRLRREAVLVRVSNGDTGKSVPSVMFLQRGMGEEVEPLRFGNPPNDCVFCIPLKELRLLLRLIDVT